MASILQPTVYLLCFGASLVCAWLLARSYRKGQTKLLLWTALCFALLALNNLLVVIDMLVLPHIDLVPLRQVAWLAAIGILIFGFVWESE